MIKKFFLFRFKTNPQGMQARLLVYAADETAAIEKANQRMAKDYGPSGPSMILRVGEGYLLKVFDDSKTADLGIGPGRSLLASLTRDDSIEFLNDRNEEIGQTRLSPEVRTGRQCLFDQQCDAKFAQLNLELRDEARQNEARQSHSQERRLDIDRDAHERGTLAGIAR